MIFGKTNKAQREIEQAEILRLITGVNHFAFFPEQIVSGKWVWMQFYWSFSTGFRNRNGDYISGSARHYLEFDSEYIHFWKDSGNDWVAVPKSEYCI